MNKDKISFFVFLCVLSAILAGPMSKWADTAKTWAQWMAMDCQIGLPQKPEGNGWVLTWTKRKGTK